MGVSSTRSGTALLPGLVLAVSACGGPHTAEDLIDELLGAYGGADGVRALESAPLNPSERALSLPVSD